MSFRMSLATNGRGAGLLVVAALLSTALVGCRVQSRSDVELTYARGVRISGYESTRVFFEQSAIGIYVGAPAVDIKPLISGPDLEVISPTHDFSRTVFEHLADGTGHTGDGTECRIRVFRLRSGKEPFPNWRLSREQSSKVATRKAEVIQIETTCEPFDN